MFEELESVARYYRTKIEQGRYRLHHSVDFAHLEKASAKNGWKITEHFSTKENTFLMDEAFWVGVWDGEKCIASVAVKRQQLGNETLAQYTKRYWARVYQRGSDRKFKFSKQQKSFLNKMKGNLVYSGEFRVHPDYQRSGIGRWLGNYAKLAGFRRWMDTEWFYIYMQKADVERGLLGVIQLTSGIPNALNWVTEPSQAQPDYTLGAIHIDDFQDWLDDQYQILCRSPEK